MELFSLSCFRSFFQFVGGMSLSRLPQHGALSLSSQHKECGFNFVAPILSVPSLVFLTTLSVSCATRSENPELVLRGAIQESQEVVHLDPLFVARQKRAERSFFGFDDSSDTEESAELAAEGEDNSAGQPEVADHHDPIVENGSKNAFNSNFVGVVLSWPLQGKITSPFGMRKGRLHAGLDLKGQKGDPIYAAADGQVLLAKRKKAYGNVVVIGHDNDGQTLYGHMLKWNVKEGQIVKAGDVIGFVGKTGRATGFHLHFETRVAGGIPQDPLRFLPPRLNKFRQVGFLK